MSDHDNIQLSDEEMALARKGEALIKAEVARVQAPQSLRERIERERERAARPMQPPFWRRHRFALGALGAAAAALAVGAVALSGGGGSGEPTFASVDATAALSPTDPAPASTGGDPPVLDASVGAIEFPDWEKKFGWRAVGSREDEVSGRSVTTVSYRNEDGAELGYAIVDGEALAAAPNGEKVLHEGKTYHVSSDGPRTVVTWTQQGHTCVIVASSKVPRAKLVELAASRNV
jgi:hypothetical protein